MSWFGNARIAVELEAIPRGRFEQNVLRAVFQNFRANDFGRLAERLSRANKNPHWWPDNSPRAGVRRVWLVARALGGWIRACGVRSPGGATRPARVRHLIAPG